MRPGKGLREILPSVRLRLEADAIPSRVERAYPMRVGLVARHDKIEGILEPTVE